MKEINLIDWLPRYLQEYREIKEIMSTENPEIEYLYKEIDITMDNQFIHTCNEKGIERFEKLLKIIPNSDDNLPGRISRVLSRWNDSIHYTYKGLIQKLNVICGEDKYSINLKNNEYTLELTVSLVFGGQVEEIDYMLSYMVPANIVVKCKNEVVNKPQERVNLAGIVVITKEITIESNLNKDCVIQGEISSSFVMDKFKERVIK